MYLSLLKGLIKRFVEFSYYILDFILKWIDEKKISVFEFNRDVKMDAAHLGCEILTTKSEFERSHLPSNLFQDKVYYTCWYKNACMNFFNTTDREHLPALLVSGQSSGLNDF